MKPRACKSCRVEFTPARSMQAVCSPMCAFLDLQKKKNKAEAKAKAEDRKLTRAALVKLKSKPTLCKEAEKAMNAYVRARDFASGCISCGKLFETGKLGGSCDAGHYRSKGSAIHCRFDERNVHAQCKHCNAAKGKAGNPVGYRRGLIAKIGLAAVEALEADQTLSKWTRDELIALRAEYVAKLKGAQQ